MINLLSRSMIPLALPFAPAVQTTAGVVPVRTVRTA
jgi:hypothetical protein